MRRIGLSGAKANATNLDPTPAAVVVAEDGLADTTLGSRPGTTNSPAVEPRRTYTATVVA